MGSNPSTVYWMDLLSIDLLLKFIICLKRPKINEKEAGVDPFFLKKKESLQSKHSGKWPSHLKRN